jgi:hypothetical protein
VTEVIVRQASLWQDAVRLLRHRFGAFERLDNALSVLVAKGLAGKHDRLGEKRVIQHTYYLLDRDRATAQGLLAQAPALGWDVARARTVVALVDGLGGSHLKDRQYLQRKHPRRCPFRRARRRLSYRGELP